VFLAKLDAMLDLIVNKKTFGDVLAFEYCYHIGAKGLPRAHILIKLVTPHTRLDSVGVDAIIQAEVPSPINFPELHAAVTKFMIHPPCASNPEAICRMSHDGQCMYRFPQRLQPTTTVSVKGTVKHRRRGENDTYVHPYSSKLLTMINSRVGVLMAMRGNRAKLARYFYTSSLMPSSSKTRHFYHIKATREESSRAMTRTRARDIVEVMEAKADITTLGQPAVTLHSHPQGLAKVQFANCIVQIRVGIDLDRLTTLGASGPVELWNVSEPAFSSQTLLPTFLFKKYLSRMSTLNGPAN
jgi:hypothetical protein